MATPVPEIDIERTRGDTFRIVYLIKDAAGVAVDLTDWTDFLLTVDPEKAPINDTANVGQLAGTVLGSALDGRVAFIPTGLIPAGRYFYDMQALDNNSEKRTLVRGRYVVVQDITKD